MSRKLRTATELFEVLSTDEERGSVLRALRRNVERELREVETSLGWSPGTLEAAEGGRSGLDAEQAGRLFETYAVTGESFGAAVGQVAVASVGEWLGGERTTDELLTIYCAVRALRERDAELLAKAILEAAVRLGQEDLEGEIRDLRPDLDDVEDLFC